MTIKTKVLGLLQFAQGDNERVYLERWLAQDLRLTDTLFDPVSGHNHNGAGTNGPVVSGSGTPTFPLRGPADTAAAPNYSFAASPSTGLYSPATNQVGLSANSTAVLTATSTLVTLPVAVSMSSTLVVTGTSQFAGNVGVGQVPGGNTLAVTGALGVTGTLAITSTAQLLGRVGVGVAPVVTGAVYVAGTPAGLSGTAQFGVYGAMTFPTSATGSGYAVQAQVATTAASFTMGQGFAFMASTAVVGAGSVITSAAGFYAQNQGRSGVVNAYGVYIENVTGASTVNIGLYNAGTTTLVGVVTSQSGINITGGAITGGGSVPSGGSSGQVLAKNSATSYDLIWSTPSSGLTLPLTQNLTFSPDNTYDIGLAAANRPRNVNVGSNVSIAGAANSPAAPLALPTVTGPKICLYDNGSGSYFGFGIEPAQLGIYTGGGIVVRTANSAGAQLFGLDPSGNGTFFGGLNVAGASTLTGQATAQNSLQVSGGTVGIGSVVASNAGLYMNATLSGSINGYGVYSAATFPTDVTNQGNGFAARFTTQAATFTMAQGFAFRAIAPTIGAGSAVSALHAFYAENMGASGVANAYGVYINAQSGASGANVGLYNGGTTTFVGVVTAQAGINITGGAITGGGSVPSGGTSGQVLAKNSATSYDLIWVTPTVYLTQAGADARYLQLTGGTLSGVLTAAAGINITGGAITGGGSVPSAGATGQVLAKNSATSYDVGWITPLTQTAADARYLLLTGGTLTGSLLFSADNTLDIGASAATRPRNVYVGTSLLTNSISAQGGANLSLATAATNRWQILNAGHLICVADNTYDIGASGATRPRDLFLGRNAAIGGTLGVTGLLTASGQVTTPQVNLSGAGQYITSVGTVNDIWYRCNTGGSHIMQDIGGNWKPVLASAFTVSSARQFKPDLRVMSDTDALARLRMPLEVQTWQPKGEARRSIGFTAEQMHEVVPELTAYADDGAPLGINYGQLTALIWAALRNIDGRLRGLEDAA